MSLPAGGTGGHIYPALAIIEQLRQTDPDVGVHILCSNRAIDTKILTKEDVPFSPIAAMPVSKKPRGLIRFIASWGPSVRETRVCIRTLQETHDSVILVAMGGFVAAPAARAAHAQRVPVVLVNLDAVPGKANVLIAKKASELFTAAPIKGFELWNRVHPIVRSSMNGGGNTGQARASFGLDPDTNTLLITGGSQGAASITNFVRTMLEQEPKTFVGWQAIHQVGDQMSDAQIDQLRSAYQDAKVAAWVEPYIDDMSVALSSADLAVGRCGAGTVAEYWAAKLPSVFFPYPHHQDEHQKHNAQGLVDAGAAIVLDDLINPDRNLGQHREAFARILTDTDARQAMRAGFETIDEPDGAAELARAFLKLG